MLTGREAVARTGIDAAALKPAECDVSRAVDLPVDRVAIDYEGREHLRSLAEAGEDRGVTVEGHCRHGMPAAEIAAAAQELSAALVVPSLCDVTPSQLQRQGVDPDRIADSRSPATA